ncbi:MAG: hypothetical protein EHM20_13945 [Alphaproteobacteria bacterium]|nr:MAG: hypothetical protein EHM20_13945 [Alphaproteobacteria bacterium]
MTVGPILYKKALENGMIDQFKDLRIKVKNIRNSQDNPISGNFNGIFWALGREMDRQNGKPYGYGSRTGPIAYEEALKIGNLMENIKKSVQK